MSIKVDGGKLMSIGEFARDLKRNEMYLRGKISALERYLIDNPGNKDAMQKLENFKIHLDDTLLAINSNNTHINMMKERGIDINKTIFDL